MAPVTYHLSDVSSGTLPTANQLNAAVDTPSSLPIPGLLMIVRNQFMITPCMDERARGSPLVVNKALIGEEMKK
jgi:hypothetical protein